MRRALAGLLLLAASATVLADQWPEFRGPTSDGHAPGAGFPLTWNERTNIAWKVPVPGVGWSSPVVADRRVWLTTAIPESNGASLRALAFDLGTGALLVSTEVFRIRDRQAPNPKNSLASPTPVAAHGRIYVHFGPYGTAALSPAGDVLWRTTLRYASQHGGGGSPAVHGDLIIINCDGHDDAYVVALEGATGRIRWRTGRRQPFDQAYTTPLVITAGDRPQVVSVGAHRAGAYDPATGREIWRVSYSGGFSNVPRPVFGHGLVFIVTGFQQPAVMAIRPDGTGDVSRTHVSWSLSRGAPLTPSPIVVGDQLYVVSDLGVLTAVDARTGRVDWQARVGGNFSASPTYADGRLYLPSEEGVTTVIAPGPAFQPLARNVLDDAILASVAAAEGTFVLRARSHLYRIAERK